MTAEAQVRALYRVADAGEYLGLCERQVRQLAADGVLERRWIGKRQYRITAASLEAYVASLPQDRPA
jgi:excisionase family DNA binding protein